MKYLEKEPFSYGYTKEYSMNYDKIDWETTVASTDANVDVDIDLDEESVKYIEEYASKNNLTFNDAAVKMITEGLAILEETESKKESEEK
ncbi:MAG: hypothetical protein Q8P81_00875 [Nanoarchaeota archaeon]|nr:hypothetical protein [Nanoarchaeota archaeon]